MINKHHNPNQFLYRVCLLGLNFGMGDLDDAPRSRAMITDGWTQERKNGRAV
jgi:hypothetical protein